MQYLLRYIGFAHLSQLEGQHLKNQHGNFVKLVKAFLCCSYAKWQPTVTFSLGWWASVEAGALVLNTLQDF